MMAGWARGSTVVLDEVWRGRLWAARPMIVVEDREDFVALWCPKGTHRKVPNSPSTRPRLPKRAERVGASLSLCDWEMGDHEWDVSTLWLMRPGDWHSVWVSWRDSGEHWGWYVNLQEPFERTAKGFRTMDLMLDVLVWPDGSWEWKDEDDFEALITNNLIDDVTARTVRDDALQMIARAEANESPFSEPWPDWRPDPSWTLPTLPSGWEEF